MSTYWWNALLDLDPDIFLSMPEAPDSVGEYLQKELQPFSIREWSAQAAEHLSIGVDSFRNVPMQSVLSHIYDAFRPIEHTRIRLPMSKPNSEVALLSFCAAAQFGILEKDVEVFTQDAPKAQTIELSTDSVAKYLSDVESFRGMLHP